MTTAVKCTVGDARMKCLSWTTGCDVSFASVASLIRQIILACLVIFCTVFLFKCIYWVFLQPFFLSPLRSLPGPKDNFIVFGQTNKFLRVSWVPQLFQSWSTRWPSSPFIRYLGVGNAESLLVNDITAYREVLQTKSEYFSKPEATRQIAKTVIGDGLPFAEGPNHKRRRAVLNKIFTLPKIKACVPAVQAKAVRLIDCIKAKQSITREVEVESYLWKATLDIISYKVFGNDLNHLEKGDSPLHELFSKTMQQSLSSHIFHFLSSYLPLRHIFPSKSNNDFIHNCGQVRQFIRDYVDSRRAQWIQGGKKMAEDVDDALQLLIEQQSEWKDEEIVEYILNLLVLGHDTTACSLVWAVHCLSIYPAYQDRLRDEFRSLNKPVSAMSYTDIESLRLLNNFIREVLRLYCPVAYIPRETIQDVTIANTYLPKGTTVQLCPLLMNMHPHVWGPSAAQFDPDRWDHLEGDAASAYAFESFHNGPRVCIGKALSMIEMKIILLALMTEFNIQSLGGEMEFASPSFTLRPKEKLTVRLTEL